MSRSDRVGGDRGQTTQDFAIGIGLFLLAVVFVITMLPTVLGPADASDDTSAAQAERIAADLVDAAAVDGERVVVNESALEAAIADLEAPGQHQSVNVTLETLDGETTSVSGGDRHDGQAASSWVRIVSTEETCEAACRLVIRVW